MIVRTISSARRSRAPSPASASGRYQKIDHCNAPSIILTAVINATGYRTSFPFLDPGLARQALGDESRPALYRRMLSPTCPGLAFAGLVQPIGPTIPLVEIQARWLASLLSGAMAPASPEDQRHEIRRHHDIQRRTWLDSPRYALEVDYRSYARQMTRDMARGRAGN